MGAIKQNFLDQSREIVEVTQCTASESGVKKLMSENGLIILWDVQDWELCAEIGFGVPYISAAYDFTSVWFLYFRW